MTTVSIKPTHKAVQAYYDSLKAYEGQGISHETAVRSAFLNLLAEAGKVHKWTLIPELTMKVKGKSIRPDGTMRDDMWLLPVPLAGSGPGSIPRARARRLPCVVAPCPP